MKDVIADFELKTIFIDGDIATGISDDQHKNLLLMCEKGSYKEFPIGTVGAFTYLESEDVAGLVREVRTKFIGDGMTINKITVGDKLIIDANY